MLVHVETYLFPGSEIVMNPVRICSAIYLQFLTYLLPGSEIVMNHARIWSAIYLQTFKTLVESEYQTIP